MLLKLEKRSLKGTQATQEIVVGLKRPGVDLVSKVEPVAAMPMLRAAIGFDFKALLCSASGFSSVSYLLSVQMAQRENKSICMAGNKPSSELLWGPSTEQLDPKITHVIKIALRTILLLWTLTLQFSWSRGVGQIV